VWRNKGEREDAREEFAREAMAHLDDLYRIATHLTRHTEEAEDLVQETYARALASQRNFEPGTHLKAWLAKILHNIFYDRYRQAQRWKPLEEVSTGSDRDDYAEGMSGKHPGPLETILLGERSAKIREAVKRLPDEFRTAVVLVDLGDLSYADAAEILSCPIGTVRSRLSRARELLRQELTDYFLDDDEKTRR